MIYNDGEPQAVVEMGEYTKVIDDTYDIAIGDEGNAKYTGRFK